MRFVAAMALMAQGVVNLRGEHLTKTATLAILTLGAAILLLAGLWTPIAGAVAMVAELFGALSQQGDIWVYILVGTFGAALALLGPGAWSVDARLFGWKRIDIRDRRS